MLKTLKQTIAIADTKGNMAVGAPNTPTFEALMAVVDTAEKLQVPVCISHAQVHEEVMPLSWIGPVMVDVAKRAGVPVAVHLDHGASLEYLAQALSLGFTSVMYDGSMLPYDENVKNTREAVRMAKEYGASVEAEIGVMGGAEAGTGDAVMNPESVYTDPKLAEDFVKKTGIDALACSFGTAHGIYKVKPKLDFDRIEKIRQLTGIPLVMHGGSGVSPEDYRTAIGKGVRKINYYSYMAREGAVAVKDMAKAQDVTFYHDFAKAATAAMQADVEKAMRVFAGM